MTELEKFGLALMFCVIVYTLVWGFMMLHNDAMKIHSDLQRIHKMLEKQ